MHTGRRLSPDGRWTRVQGYLAQPRHSLSEMCWKWWGMCPRYEGYVSNRNNSRSERCRNASKCKFPGSEAFWSYQRNSQNGYSTITVAPRQPQQVTQHQHDNMTTGGWKCAEKDGNPPERAWGQGNGHEAQCTRYTHFFSFFTDFYYPLQPCPLQNMTSFMLNSTFSPIWDISNMPIQHVWHISIPLLPCLAPPLSSKWQTSSWTVVPSFPSKTHQICHISVFDMSWPALLHFSPILRTLLLHLHNTSLLTYRCVFGLGREGTPSSILKHWNAPQNSAFQCSTPIH